jgi:predicted MPP superfamily phosphohydrolase
MTPRDWGVKPLRIAHITDLHARFELPGEASAPGRDYYAIADSLAAALYELGDVDLLALTGDLIDVPEDLVPGEARAEEQVEADYRRLRELLEARAPRYCVLPGNHDWAHAMARAFDQPARELAVGGYLVAAFWDEEGEAHVPFRPPGERDRFEMLLRRPEPQIHLQHYLLAPHLPDAGWPYNYAEVDALREAVVSSGCVALCLAGHYHDGTPPLRIGGTTFITGPAFCRPERPWRVYGVSDGGVTVEAR